jgi:hypothetical protein
VLDDGAPNRSDVLAASVTTTMSSLTSGNAQLPLFTDNGGLFSGAITANGSQQTGLAGRISVNLGLLGDPSRTIVFSTSPLTAAGDTTRSDFILTQLQSGTYRYSPQTGIGTTGAPFTGTLVNFAKQFISQQGEAATAAKQLVRRSVRGAEHLAEEGDGCLGRQYRRRDGASARAAECLFRQCARHVVHQADVRHADPGHVRVHVYRWR